MRIFGRVRQRLLAPHWILTFEAAGRFPLFLRLPQKQREIETKWRRRTFQVLCSGAVTGQRVHAQVSIRSGVYTLRSSENEDAFLKAQGIGWVLRKAAKAVGTKRVVIGQSPVDPRTNRNKPRGCPDWAPFDPNTMPPPPVLCGWWKCG